MRAGLDADMKLDVLVLDINEDEADEILATFDPISRDGRVRRAGLALA